MKKTVDAIYQHGVFTPLKPLKIRDGEAVRLTIETALETKTEDLMSLAAQVYEDLTAEEIDEVEQIALRRQEFF